MWAFIDSAPAGCIQIGPVAKKEKTYCVKFVTVNPAFRQQGIARILIQSVCQLLTQESGVTLEFSSYEKEGEVMIPMMKDIAQSFPEITIKHRLFGQGYQNAQHDFFREGDLVWVEDRQTGYTGEGEVMFLEETDPLTIMVKTRTPSPQAVRILASELKKLVKN